MPLGSAMLLTWILTNLHRGYRALALHILVTGFLAISIQTYTELYFDWNKQKEVISLLAESKQIQRAQLVIFDDRTENARNRQYRFYEWNGLLKAAFRDERRFGISVDEFSSYQLGAFDALFVPCRIAREHVRRPNENIVMVQINYKAKDSAASFSRYIRHIYKDNKYSLGIRSMP